MTLKEKQVTRAALLSEGSVAIDFLGRYEKREAVPYDFARDPRNVRIWYAIARKFDEAGTRPSLSLPLAASLDDIKSVVTTIVETFKRNVEENGCYSLLLNDDGSPRKENIVQRAFQAIALAYCEASNLDLAPEPNAGRGPVDFKFSHGSTQRVLVEFKRSKSTQLIHGFTGQLATYEKAEATARSIYVVLDYGDNDSGMDKLRQLDEESRVGTCQDHWHRKLA